MEFNREFFPRVRKTVMPRPHFVQEQDILGQSGTAWAVDAAVYGDNWHINREQGLVEIYEAGAALSFYHLLPRKDKYEQEGLYLRLKLAYRTTENANVNIRNFSGNHVTLPNSIQGHMYDDPQTYWYITDDLTININSIYSGEKIWIQRVDWEWMSKEVVYEDELDSQDIYLQRSAKEIEKLYKPQSITPSSVKNFLIEKIQKDDQFAKRCLAILSQEQLMNYDLTELFKTTGIKI
ncbi:MAG: hypothetical protein D6756_10495 [Cyanobacteria bacterium J083]|nr:MAG: hypothetical protein D6756_10495 [Cyanobacteria bacterium J083]